MGRTYRIKGGISSCYKIERMIARGGKSAWFYPATAVLETHSFQQMGRPIEWYTLTANGSTLSVIGIDDLAVVSTQG